jgi:hypothetical protein
LNIESNGGRAVKTSDWICHDGSAVRLALMTSAHMRNALEYLRIGTGQFGPMLRYGCSGFTNQEWIQLFRAELLRRSRFGGD